jgi:hypothetical protein
MRRIARTIVMSVTAALCAAGASLFSACSSAQPNEGRVRSDGWPFSRSQYDSRTGELRSDTLPPFFTESTNDGSAGPRTDRPGERPTDNSGREETTLRPFYSYVRDPAKDTVDRIGLYPLFQSRQAYRTYGPEDDRRRSSSTWLLPFFYYNYFSSAPGEWEYDYFAPFPLIAGGDSSRDGPSFAVIPFAGTLKGVLGVDEINFIGGPLYVELREGDTHVWYFPWPLIRYGEGPHYSTAAVLPFYAHSRQDGSYERYSVAWPFVSWGEDQLSTRWPRQYWTVFPFAARSWTAAQELFSILPPFFNFGSSPLTGQTVIDAPWPIFRYANGPRYEEFRIWPLYSQMRLDDDWTYNALWPFIWHFEENDPNWRESRTWVLPFWASRHREYKPESDGTVRTFDSVHGWPLMSYRKEVDDSWKFQFPDPLPPLGERFERLYGDLFKLVALEGGNGKTSVELLWGAMRAYDDANESAWAVNPFLSYRRLKAPGATALDAGDRDEFSMFHGLIGHEKQPEGTKVKFLWLFGADYE